MTQLGQAGLIPFGAAAIIVWLGGFLLPTYLALEMHVAALVYGAVIASYLAGIGAGGLLTTGAGAREGLLPGMIATLVAWIAALPGGFTFFSVGGAWKHLMIVGVLAYLLLRDLRAVDRGDLPRWYGDLRKQLTFWASGFLILIACRLFLWGHY